MELSNYTKKLFLFGIVLFLAVASSCKKDDPKPGTNEVFIKNSAFDPSSMTVAVNTTITWKNQDNTNHSVTSDSALFDSGTIGDGSSFSHQFTTAGTFPYHCKFHSGMKATIVVQ